MNKSGIKAIAHVFPDKITSSHELEDMISAGSEYTPTHGIIESVTGIQKHHVSAPNEYNSTLAIRASEDLFDKHSEITKESIDLLIFASAGQDILEPATAHIVQKEIGTNCPVLDVTNACNSFLNALQIADAFIKNGTYRRILIVTGEVSTKSAKLQVQNRNDFKQSFPGYTFGDAGTAAVVEKSESEHNELLDFDFVADSRFWDTAILAGGGSRFMHSEKSFFQGDGHELKTAFDTVGPDFILNFLQKKDLAVSDINHVFVHQVSLPYLDSFREACGFTKDQIEETVSWCGNVAAASLPLAWSLRNDRGDLKKDDIVLLVGLAGGISLGAALIKV